MRIGSRRRARAQVARARTLLGMLLGAALAAASGSPEPAAALPDLDLVVSGSELEKSFIQISNGGKIGFTGPTSYDVDIDVLAGTVHLDDFVLPNFLNTIGVNFVLTQIPAAITGSFTVLPGGLSADLLFPSVTVDFTRDGFFDGSLTFDLTTGDSVIPEGCNGRTEDQVLSGSPLDFLTGHVELVASVCPQVAFFNGNPNFPWVWDEAFRVFLRGTLSELPTTVPEPGTSLLVAVGLAGLGAAGRRRAARPAPPTVG